MPSGQSMDLRETLDRLRKAADIYQATVRPFRHDESEDDRRRFEYQKALQNDLLAALGEAHDALAK